MEKIKLSNETMEEVSIILTAAIDIKGMSFTKRSDIDEREQDYINSLRQWMKTGLPIIFCENSGHDLSKIYEMTSNYEKIEILQFDGQNFDKKLGKGFGEQKIIRYVAENSIFFRKSKRIMKVTGRYYLKNIKQFEESLSMINGVSVILLRNLTFADGRLIISTPEFLTDYLFSFTSKVNDTQGYYFEHALAQAVHKYMSESGEWTMLPYYPILEGYSGSANVKTATMYDNFKGKLLYILKLWVLKRRGY